MDRQEILTQLEGLIGEYLKAQGYELVELIYRYEGRDLYLRVLADRAEGGITLDECSSLNSGIGAMLDEKNLVDARYILEVSSPGLDRPLRTKADFLRCLNRRARLFLRESLEGRSEIEGLIKGLAGDNVVVEEGAKSTEVPLSKISKARQIIGE
jgi:ribosome maturation factor RimP